MAHRLPFSSGERFTADINGLTHSGEGVGRYREVPVFIPGAIPGDRVDAVIRQVKRNFARGELLAVSKPAPARQTPPCSRFGRCGGCAYQMMKYGEQLKWKGSQVKDSLTRIGRLSGVPVMDAVGLDDPWYYRNKATFQVGRVNGKILLGFFEKGAASLAGFDEEGNEHAPATECLLPDKDINKIGAELTSILNKGAIATEFLAPLQQVQIRRSSHTGEVSVTLITETGRWPAEKALAGIIGERLPEITSLSRGVEIRQPGGGLVRNDKLLAGKPFITDKIGSLTYRIASSSFYQVNPGLTGILYEKTREYAGLKGGETIVDAYGGIGAVALYLARQAGKVLGLEANPTAVADARANATLNRIDNAEFKTGAVEVLLPAMVEQGLQPDVLILDPPRRGCAPAVLEAAATARAKRIIYLSCNPATLSRDLRQLAERGYTLREAQPIDMFPWTAHVETVCWLD